MPLFGPALWNTLWLVVVMVALRVVFGLGIGLLITKVKTGVGLFRTAFYIPYLTASVAVVGAGGIGSPAIQYLAAAGVGRLVIIDDDTVDLSNLQRQVIHDTAAVGTSKVANAAARVRALNPDVTVAEHATRLDGTNAARLFAGYDVAICNRFDNRAVE